MTIWLILTLALVMVPAMVAAGNALLFDRLPRRRNVGSVSAQSVSVLIPARNEEQTIADAIEAVLASQDVDVDLHVMDDESTDRTAAIVREIAERDPRVHLHRGKPLPAGWCGKQWACRQLADHARSDWLVWIDADVRLAPHTLAAMADQMQRRRLDLFSGFPRQITRSIAERLVVPMIQLVLVGYLPMWFMKWTRHPAFGAGCGQLMMARRSAYESIGGHEAIRASLHDGVMLPRAFRARGLATDLFDGTDAATCRMYQSAGEVWHGFAKNATEGMATPIALPIWTMLLIGGHVAPWINVVLAAGGVFGPHSQFQLALVTGAATLAAGWRVLTGIWFNHSAVSVLLHPVGVLMLIAIQWYALARKTAGLDSGWKGRTYIAGGGGA